MKRGYLIAGLVCAALCIACAAAVLWPSGGDDPLHTAAASPQPTPSAPTPPPASPEPSREPYVSPIDFTALQAENPDIYAWLEISNTNVSYPVLQRVGDDAFYMNHNSRGEYSDAGALFTESVYNSGDFSDPVNIIYGHWTRSGALFGSLQSTYSDPEDFAACRDITVYLPDQEQHYQVFAAVPYDKRHILYNYNFEKERMYRAFLNSIYEVRAIGANFAEDGRPTAEDQMLILSTCLNGRSDRRYLVLATRVE